MRRNISGIIIALALVVMLSGCGGNAGNVMVSMPGATEAQSKAETPAPTETATAAAPETPEAGTPAPVAEASPTTTVKPEAPPQAEVYVIDGARIYRQSGEGNTLVYDAASYFDKGWDCRVAHLSAEDGVLYFSESGMPGDDFTESVHRVIRKDGNGRTVIQEDNVVGYTQLVLYGDKIFIVRDGFDSQDIKWAYKNGSSTKDLDFSEYESREGIKSYEGIMNYYNSATLYMKDGKLYADILFYVDADPEIVDHTVSISEDLKITRVK